MRTIIFIIAIIVIAVFAYFLIKTTKKEPLPDPAIPQLQAEAFVKEKWGDCLPPACTKLEVRTRQTTTGNNVVTAIYSQKSTSVASIKKEGMATYLGGIWTLGKPFETQACLPKHGHAGYGNTPCSTKALPY
ncbi:MAG: hypothetical protein RL641_339 [Candidatus Parcubacteria bacterium]